MIIIDVAETKIIYSKDTSAALSSCIAYSPVSLVHR